MRYSETEIVYPTADERAGVRIRIYESQVDFREREFFEHRHSDFELSLILSGEGVYRFADRTETISAGDAFVFGSNKVHCITESRGDEPMRLFNLQLEPRFIWSPFSNMLPREYVGLFSGKCEKLSFGSKIHEKITEKLKNIRTESLERRVGYEIVVRSLLCEALAELMRASERASALDPVRAGASRPSESLCSMDRAMDHINSHLDQPLTLAELARVAGFGRTYFSTLFSELNGLSPWEYIRIRRIERAKSLLAATDLSVLEVSERSGFSNLSNFNRAFLAGVGMTPREYRKEHRAG